jgi:hypothetical protein
MGYNSKTKGTVWAVPESTSKIVKLKEAKSLPLTHKYIITNFPRFWYKLMRAIKRRYEEECEDTKGR